MEIEIIKSLVKRFRKERTKENWCLLENFIVDKSFCISTQRLLGSQLF
jgi:hypothetical protein